MKAIVFDNYGSPEVLQLREVEKPVPADNEVLVKIHATSVTSGDVPRRKAEPFLIRLFTGLKSPKRGMNILGSEFAGEIESVGKNVGRFAVGDHVFGLTGWSLGANAEYISLPENSSLISRPANISFEEAAAIPFGAGTALYFLRKASIKPGQEVLIYGASGSVGTFAIQLAKYYGAAVTGVCSSANLDLVKSLGADKVIDYTQEDFTTTSKSFDVIFDTVGKTSFAEGKRLLKQDGVFIEGSIDPIRGYSQQLWTSITSSKKLITGIASIKSSDLSFLKELIETGKLRPAIDRCYPLEEIVEAHRYVERGHKKGNVVITVEHTVTIDDLPHSNGRN